MQRRMLTKEDEQAVGDEVEVRREDQDKINKFSRLHQRELKYEEGLKLKNKEKEELDDITMELELADEDDKIPSVLHRSSYRFVPLTEPLLYTRYKIGDSFFHVTVSQAQGMLEASTTKIDEEVSQLEEKLSTAREEMTQLKVELYARFGRSINLET
ncbi:Prefoldin subunit 4 [Cytospora mali]|uniref:Prefoldin subunit 4 n=1 Tax=Cytospora mali TaxID=578113 RepID=A0A194VTP3_CYTMA|nr:Prefoldin subunit 4 [Valsa mali]